MGLASLVTIPIGMLCYAVEMRDYAEKYGRVVAAKNHMGAPSWSTSAASR